MTGAILGVLACALAAGPAQPAQKAASTSTKSGVAGPFEPIERWKAAVMAGDRSALAAFYPAVQGGFAQTPQGQSTDPNEEPEFWGGLHSRGLASINPKILQMSTPQAGVAILTLRIEMTMQVGAGRQDVFVSGAQVWVEQGGNWFIYRSKRTDLLLKPTIRLPEPVHTNPQLYPEPREAQRDLEAALAAARTDHKRVLVVFGANWCYDCHVLDATFHSNTVAPIVQANYHVVHINVGDGSENNDLARRCEVQPDKLPSLAVLDGKGGLVTSQKNGEFDNAVKIGMGDVTGFLERWKPGGGR
jgi:thioredoxin 1